MSFTSICSGDAKIKPEFLVCTKPVPVPASSNTEGNRESTGNDGSDALKTQIDDVSTEPVEKKAKVENEAAGSGEGKRRKRENKGQNKHRPGPMKFKNEKKLCPLYVDGNTTEKCKFERCPFMHDIKEFLETKVGAIDTECPNFTTYGKCSRGLSCAFAASHTDENSLNVVNQELWDKMKPLYESTHSQLINRDTQYQLRKRTYDFKSVDKICSSLHSSGNSFNSNKGQNNGIKTSGAVTDEDVIPLKVDEIKKIDWTDKLYLSPLTTVGNLPFRRMCVDFGADITCSEMSLATSILQGNNHEFALHRRHPSEKIWGVQLCANNGIVAAKAAKVLADVGIEYDFVDLNMGCPLDAIFKQGAGSGLMCRTNKFQSVVKSMTAVLGSVGKPFTVKMRTGVKIDKNFAHTLIPFCRDTGVAMVTLHGRTRDQRYLKNANWDYIGECAKLADPMPLFGNGDILSWEEYVEKKKLSNATGVMIGRGALIKPWIFQEIKEQRHIDFSSKERLELVQRYCNYGLDHWGSDPQGVETTRRFLLEWLSFCCRYIPFGILEQPPQRIQERPPKYVGRDETETLLSSSNANDWIKISEMFLGPVPEMFEFLPKHKANAWG